MIISLLDIGSDTLLENFDAAGIKYVRCLPRSGESINAGEIIKILNLIAGMISIMASCFSIWSRVRDSRKVIIAQSDRMIHHVQGKSTAEIEKLLTHAKMIMVFETKKSEQ